MNRRVAAALASGACTLALVAPTVATAAPSGDGISVLPSPAVRPAVVPRELVVVLRDGVAPRAARALHRAVGTDPAGRAPTLGIDVVRVPAGRSIAAAMRDYLADPRVASVEPNLLRSLDGHVSDPRYPQQWSMENTAQTHPTSFGGRRRGRPDADVDAHAAWNVTTGDPGVVVAVIDSGIDLDHPDLAGAIWVNPGEIADNGIDDDVNGYVDDVHGWDFEGRDPDPDPLRRDPHGTHVAGVIAAQHDGYGIAGLCPGCRIMPLRFGLTVAQEIRAIEYAVDNGASIINMSFGGPVWSAAERAAIDAAGDAGLLVVASAGNESLDNDVSAFMSNGDASPNFPASYDLPEIVSVAASTDRDVYGYGSYCDRRGLPTWVCAFTNWGRVSVDVAAPGVDILSTVVEGEAPGGGDHETWDGTSMSAPHVAAIAGLLRSSDASLTPVEVKNAIMNGVDHPDALRLTSYYHDELGIGAGPLAGRFTVTQGRVNAAAALAGDTSNATPRADGTIRGARSMRRAAVGRVGWPADVNDVFAKRLRAATRYRVTLDGRGRADLDLFVWNRGTDDIWQFDASCFQIKGSCQALRGASVTTRADEELTFRSGGEGTYYVHVSAWFSGARYRIEVDRI